MPSSAAKKRRANKKRKAKAANSHSTTNSQRGNGDRKTHDRKDKDVGEISFSKSEPDHRPIAKDKELGEVDRKGRDSHPSTSVVIADSKPMEVSQNGADNGTAESKQMEVQEEEEVVQDIEVTKELKPDEDPGSKVISIESNERDAGSSSSTSSSHGESRLGDKNSPVIESEKMEEEEKNGGSVVETVPDTYSAGQLVEEKSANSITDTVPHVDLAGKSAEEEKKIDGSVTEAAPAVDSAEPVVSSTEEVTQASVSTAVVDAGVSNGIGLASKDEEEVSLPLSSKTAGASMAIRSSNAPIVETSGSGSAELSKEVVITESSENQPPLGSIPPPVERTSWKCCCGIFDLLRGSDR